MELITVPRITKTTKGKILKSRLSTTQMMKNVTQKPRIRLTIRKRQNCMVGTKQDPFEERVSSQWMRNEKIPLIFCDEELSLQFRSVTACLQA